MKIIKNPVQLAKKLVSIESISGNEYEIGQYIYKYLREIGLKPRLQKVEDKRFNVFVKGSGGLLLQGHIDTVPFGDLKDWKYSPLGQIVKDKLYGRGTTDMKGNVACVLAALAKNPTQRVSCGFTVGEENTFVGIKELMKLRKTVFKRIEYCITLEPTDLRVIAAHKGQITFKVTTKGKAAHGSVPEKGENAILKMQKVISVLEAYTKKIKSRKHKLVGHATLNVGVICGGTIPNGVPDFTYIKVDRRIVPGENPKTVINEIKKTVHPAKVEINRIYQPVELDAKTPIVKLMQRFLKEEKLNPRISGATYTTEFSELTKHSIQGLIFGVGATDQAHKVDEYMYLKDIEKCTTILGKLLDWVE